MRFNFFYFLFFIFMSSAFTFSADEPQRKVYFYRIYPGRATYLKESIAMNEANKTSTYYTPNPKHPYDEINKYIFYSRIFENAYVEPTETLDGLTDFDYIFTEDVFNTEHLKILSQYPKEKLVLFCFESQISQPQFHDAVYLEHFGKVFTWNDDFIDNKKFFRIRYPWCGTMPLLNDLPSFNQRNLAVIVGNFSKNKAPFQNYTGREDLINFFEKNYPKDLGLYGSGWDLNKDLSLN